jgi:hypothetical protein
MKIDYGFKFKTHFLQETGHFSWVHICSSIEESLQKRNIRHVKIYCKDDYVILESLRDRPANGNTNANAIYSVIVKNIVISFKKLANHETLTIMLFFSRIQ